VVIALGASAVWNFQHKSDKEESVQSNLEPKVNYENSEFGFSLKLPEGFEIKNLEEVNGEMFLVEGGDYQMQIFVSDFDEAIALTVERIKRDIPDLQMQDVGEIEVGGAGAVSFTDAEQNTREIWFVRNYKLYQISSSPEESEISNTIIGSWSWQ